MKTAPIALLLALLCGTALAADGGPLILSQEVVPDGLRVTFRTVVEREARLRVCVNRWRPDGLATVEVACAPEGLPMVSPPYPAQPAACLRTQAFTRTDKGGVPRRGCEAFQPDETCVSCEEVEPGSETRTFLVPGACDAQAPERTGRYSSCTVTVWDTHRYQWVPCPASLPPCP